MKTSATKIFSFDAAHSLPGHSGKCAAVHGHTYRLEVTVARYGSDLIIGGSSDGMIIDFGDLKAIVHEEIIDKADHRMLNDIYPFRTTAENMAQYFYKILQKRLMPMGIEVDSIRLWETPTAYVEVKK